jgi:solute carrier family 1 (high affinity glutamate transporter) protein 2
LVSSIHPGDPQLTKRIGEGTLDDTALSTLDTFLDQVRNMFPENIVQATFQQVQTDYVAVKPKLRINNSSSLVLVSNGTQQQLMKRVLTYTNEVNVLGEFYFLNFNVFTL